MYLYIAYSYIYYVTINYTDYQRCPIVRNNASNSEHRLCDNYSDSVILDLLINLSGKYSTLYI